MRDDYSAFVSRGAEILAVGPDDRNAFRKYWAEHAIPFIGLPDPEHRVARLYRQQVKVLKWGRLPLVCILDRNGKFRYVNYGQSMSDIPANSILLDVIDAIHRS